MSKLYIPGQTFLREHELMQKHHSVPEDHVIIDRKDYQAIIEFLQDNNTHMDLQQFLHKREYSAAKQMSPEEFEKEYTVKFDPSKPKEDDKDKV